MMASDHFHMKNLVKVNDTDGTIEHNNIIYRYDSKNLNYLQLSTYFLMYLEN